MSDIHGCCLPFLVSYSCIKIQYIVANETQHGFQATRSGGIGGQPARIGRNFFTQIEVRSHEGGLE